MRLAVLMSSLFDDLRNKLEKESGASGISAWDLAQLPHAQRRIIRLILREVQMPYADLCHAAASLPPPQRLDPAQIDKALAELVAQDWLIRLGQENQKTFRVNLRRKAASRVGASIWEQLERQIGAASAETG